MKSARPLALAGVLLTAVLMVILIRPAMREIVGPYGQPVVGVLILAVPTVALLTATSYRYYGLMRALVVALCVIVTAGIVSGIAVVLAVGAAQMPSSTAFFVFALILAAPFLSVLVLGMLALRLVPGVDGPSEPELS